MLRKTIPIVDGIQETRIMCRLTDLRFLHISHDLELIDQQFACDHADAMTNWLATVCLQVLRQQMHTSQSLPWHQK